MPLFPRASVSAGSTLELRERTVPGELGLVVAFDESWLPPAEALFSCVPEGPMLPGVPDGRAPYQPRKTERSDVSLLYSSLVRWRPEKSGQVETDSEINRTERVASRMR